MKKLIAAILLISLVAAAVGIGTWAYFSDYEHSVSNSFCAGSLDLKVDGQDDPNVATFFEIECMQPGDEGLVQMTLANTGCVDGVVDIHLYNLVDWEHLVIEPEAEGNLDPVGPAGPSASGPSSLPDYTDNETEGELSQYLEMKITADMDDNGSYETLVVDRDNLTDIVCKNYVFGDLLGETEVGLQIEWWLPENIGNIIMTDCVTFDIEFSLNQKVGDVIGEVISPIAQAASVLTTEDYTYDVTVHNAGTIAGNFWLNTVILNSSGQTVFTGNQYVENLAPCSSNTYSFTWPATHTAGSYKVVANVGESVVECPFVVNEPALLQVTAIGQPPSIQVCENLNVTVSVKNNGGVANNGDEMCLVVAICPPTTFLISPKMIPVGVIQPGETKEYPVAVGHVKANWKCPGTGKFYVVAGFDLTTQQGIVYCPVAALLPPDIKITGIQAPTGVQPCENITIGVDLHNAGDKAGAGGTLTLTVRDGTEVLFSGQVQVPTLAPCVTTKFPFGPIHIEEAQRGHTLTVEATYGTQVMTKTIAVATPPNIVVTGFQQPPTVPYCEAVTISADVHNTGGKPGASQVTMIIRNATGGIVFQGTKDTGTIAPCATIKVPFGPWHAGQGLPVGTLTVETIPAGPPHFITILETPPTPTPTPAPTPTPLTVPAVSTSWKYAVDFVSDYDVDNPGNDIVETDLPQDYHLVAQNVMPGTTACRPCLDLLLCPNKNNFPWQDFGLAPQVSSYYIDVDTHYNASKYLEPQRAMALFGNNMSMQLRDLKIWKSMANDMDVFETNWLLPPLGGFNANFDMATFPSSYTGAQPGWPYNPVPSERFGSTWSFGGKVAAGSIFSGCVPPWPYWISCHVLGTETITVPAGTYDTVRILCTYTYAGFDDDEDARDSDQDGYVDGQELREGTNPNNPASYPAEAAESPTLWIDEDGGDFVDNDGDTRVDEETADGYDNDIDGVVDENDFGNDGVDDDGDGRTDEDRYGDNSDGGYEPAGAKWDEDNSKNPPLPFPQTHVGIDNDGDTYVDEDAVASGAAPADGSRETWYSPTLGVVVKYIWTNAPYFGTETGELSVAPSP